ncbi:hypothetical protein BBJ28_00009991 [Nothophytophthora sp. Chile5]|nr:hypothetical protein BBJ28_00009991 [Nothophytophthora sp. Chile5]
MIKTVRKREALHSSIIQLEMLGRQLLRAPRGLAQRLPLPSKRFASASQTHARQPKADESNFSRYAGMAFFGVVVCFLRRFGFARERRDGMLPCWATAGGCGANGDGHVVSDLAWNELRFVDGNHGVSGRVAGTKRRLLLGLGGLSAQGVFGWEIDTSHARMRDCRPNVTTGRTPVIVNRGWLPRKLLDVHMALDKKENDGDVSFVGVLRHGEVNRQFFYLDHEELAEAMGITSADLPVIVDALGKHTQVLHARPLSYRHPKPLESVNIRMLSLAGIGILVVLAAGEGKRGAVTLEDPIRKSIGSYLEFYMTPEKHAGYAATW